MLWQSTSRGLYGFDPSSGRIVRYRHDPNGPFILSSDEIRQPSKTRQGRFGNELETARQTSITASSFLGPLKWP
jgi:hypothetical protein